MDAKTTIGSGMLLLSIFFMANVAIYAEALPDHEYALIVISSYDVDPYELEKGQQYYKHLLGMGLETDHVLLLDDGNGNGSSGESTIDNVESGFEWLIEVSDIEDTVHIYISDHVPPPAMNSTCFCFTDGNITFSSMDSWMDEVSYDMMEIYVGGNHSGRASNHFSGQYREMICSMSGSSSFVIDAFDLARGLEDEGADLDENGVVSFQEAYIEEEGRPEVSCQYPVFIG